MAAIPPFLLGKAHSFAIGGQSAGRLAARVGAYRALAIASTVVVGAGTNDLAEGAGVAEIWQSWERILTNLPMSVRVLCMGIPEPMVETEWAENIRLINQGVERQCLARGHRFLAITPGRDEWADVSWAADGVHLDSQGTRLLAQRIRLLLSTEGET